MCVHILAFLHFNCKPVDLAGCLPGCQATWVRQSPNPIRTIRVTLTGETNLGPVTVGVGHPSDKDEASAIDIVNAACDSKLDLAWQAAYKAGRGG